VPGGKEEISSKVIKGCIKGKSKYQELLYRQFYAYGMSICLRYAHCRDEAAEILNDGFLKIFQNISKFDFSQQFKPWLRRIMINTAIDNYRKNQKHYNHLDETVVDEEMLDVGLINDLEINDIMKLLNELPENYRLTFNLYEIEGYSHQEIAQMLGIAEGTSRSNLTRARNLLQKAFSIYYKKNYAEVV
jgi:RNA polymerase sigma-70 factor (ECF subfamily)